VTAPGNWRRWPVVSVAVAAIRRALLLPAIQNPLARRIAGGAFWSFSGLALAQTLAMLASVLIARLLGKVGFGELGMVRNTLSTIGTFAGLGLGLTATKYVAEHRLHDPSRAGRVMTAANRLAVVSAGLAALAVLATAPALAATINAPHLVVELRLGAGLLFFEAMNGAQVGALAGLEAYRTLAIVNLTVGVINLPVTVVGAYALGVRGAVAAVVATGVIRWAVNRVAIVREATKAGIDLAARDLRSELPLLWRFSIPAVLSGAIPGPFIWLCNTIIVNQQNGYAEMGIMAAANSLRAFVLFIPSALFRPLLPVLASEFGRPDRSEDDARLHTLNAYATWFVATAVTAVLLYFVRPVTNLYGAGFESGTTAIMLVLASIPVMTYKDGIGRLIQARAMLWYSVASNLLWGVLLVGATYVLRKDGARGLSAAFLLAHIINTAIVVPFYFRKLRMLRFVVRDLFLGVLLSAALLPGVLNEVVHPPTWLSLAGGIVTLALLGFAGWRIVRWLR
jgi:O-antigen/teichoic acid export membrane protein